MGLTTTAYPEQDQNDRTFILGPLLPYSLFGELRRGAKHAIFSAKIIGIPHWTGREKEIPIHEVKIFDIHGRPRSVQEYPGLPHSTY